MFLNKFICWLKDSGITNNNNEKVTDSLNPFKKIIENPSHPLARIYRNDFWETLKDLFNVIEGKHYPKDKTQGRKGLLDLLIFPLIARHLHEFNKKPANTFVQKLINGAALFFFYVFETLRHTLAALLTLCLSPFVLLLRLAVWHKASQLHQQVSLLTIEELNESNCSDDERVERINAFRIDNDTDTLLNENNNTPTYQTIEKKLAEYLTQHKTTLSQIKLDKISENTRYARRTSGGLPGIESWKRHVNLFRFKNSPNLSNTESKAAEQALAELNFGGARIS